MRGLRIVFGDVAYSSVPFPQPLDGMMSSAVFGHPTFAPLSHCYGVFSEGDVAVSEQPLYARRQVQGPRGSGARKMHLVGTPAPRRPRWVGRFLRNLRACVLR